MQIGSALGRARPRTARAEHLGKQIAKRGRMVDAARREIESLEPAGAARVLRVRHEPRVVARAPLRIHQRLVRLDDLTEAHFRRVIPGVHVRMKAPRQTPIRPLDVGLGGAVRQAEHKQYRSMNLLIDDHFFSSSTTSASITSPCEPPPGVGADPVAPGPAVPAPPPPPEPAPACLLTASAARC